MLRGIKLKLLTYLLTVLIVTGCFGLASSVSAATIYLKSSATTVKVGGTFTVKVLVNTQDKVINNVESSLVFPNDLVDVVSVSSRSSIFSLWVEAPSFSNSSGLVTFNGGVPNPGYSGSGGEVVTVTLRAKSPGTATFYFSGPSIRENDGLGTDILSGQGTATVNITGTPTPEAPAPTEPTAPVAPKLASPSIYSATYPDQNSWYTAKNGSVAFRFASGATTVQTAINNSPYSVPTVSYKPPISSKAISNLTDGTWYFHFRYQLNGEWSTVAHYRIQIDTLPPDNLALEVVSSTSGLALKVSAKDLNLDRYEIFIDGNLSLTASPEQATNPLALPNLTAGEHQIKLIAYDKAGNKAELSKTIKVETLSAPIINYLSNSINVGDKFTVVGSSTPNTFLKVVLKLETGNDVYYDAGTDSQGNFYFLSEPVLVAGNHSVRAYAFNSEGLISPDSSSFNLSVKASPVAFAFVWPTINVSWPLVLSVIGLFAIIFVLLYGWYKFFVTRRKLLLARRHADQAFMMLLDRAEQQIGVLDKASKKRKLSRPESVALFDLKEIMKKIREIKSNDD